MFSRCDDNLTSFLQQGQKAVQLFDWSRKIGVRKYHVTSNRFGKSPAEGIPFPAIRRIAEKADVGPFHMHSSHQLRSAVGASIIYGQDLVGLIESCAVIIDCLQRPSDP